MRLLLLGTGTCVPDPLRKPSGNVVTASGGIRSLVIDLGAGTLDHVPDWESVREFLFTHHHPDHTGGLIQLLQGHLHCRVRPGPQPVLRLYGPPKARAVFEALRDVVADDPSSMETVVKTMEWMDVRDGDELLLEPFRIRCLATGHTRDSVGYRIAANEGTVTITGDASWEGRLEDLLAGVDAAVVECSFPPGVPGGRHLGAGEIGDLLRDLGSRAPRQVILTHLSPHTIGAIDTVLRAMPDIPGHSVIIGSDGMKIEVP